MIHTLDTCTADPRDQCAFEVDARQVDPGTQWPVLIRAVKRCSIPSHQAAASDAALYTLVAEEQKRRTRVFNLALQVRADLAIDDFSFSYDQKRTLQVQASRLTPAQKSRLQADGDRDLGAGKIEVL